MVSFQLKLIPLFIEIIIFGTKLNAMKYKTLIKRYKNLGYPVKELEPNMELGSIIEWAFKEHDVFIGLSF